ncbi:MAG: hydantoinase/oxoprolinase family protein [Thaumarchaeota archaeon]|nr:hydantoinase/oxoprolinase family protein [Nitrososphaerota archaeon]
MKRQLAIGVDVGGTFTDLIISDSSSLSVLKVPTSDDPIEAVVLAMRRLGDKARKASLISHATTLATNALLTRSDLARTALITNEGFRDVLEIGRQRRPELYDLQTRRPTPLVERRDRFTVRCRMDAHGSVLQPLDRTQARSVAASITRLGFESVAICFLNSYLDPEHELEMKDILMRKGFSGHISLSSDVDRQYREYERTSTTAVNAALAPLMTGYLSRLQNALSKIGVRAPVYVMNSDGGASTVSFASSRPVTSIESGPAAGVVASTVLARQLHLQRVLTFDMGGTTAKAGTVVGGEPELTSEFEAAGRTHSGRSIRGSGYPVRGSFIDLAEVSAGGGTVAWLDEGGELQAGPRSAGADPGPACYARGGTEPTVTDANMVLGRLNPRYLLGGEMPVRRDLATRSIRRLSRRLGMSESEAATGILRLVNNSMARAISIVSVERGRDPRDFTMFAFGGAGPLHICDLAEDLSVSELVIPVHAGIFSAYGLVAGDLTRTFTEPATGPSGELTRIFRELDATSAREMGLEGFRSFTTKRYVEARYRGQSHELLLEYQGVAALRKAFDARHRALYGYSSSDILEVVSAKVRATVAKSSPGRLTSSGSAGREEPDRRRAWVGGTVRSVDVFRREALRPGDAGPGPSIIEEYDSTLVVNPHWKWKVEEYGTRLSR